MTDRQAQDRDRRDTGHREDTDTKTIKNWVLSYSEIHTVVWRTTDHKLLNTSEKRPSTTEKTVVPNKKKKSCSTEHVYDLSVYVKTAGCAVGLCFVISAYGGRRAQRCDGGLDQIKGPSPDDPKHLLGELVGFTIRGKRRRAQKKRKTEKNNRERE